jgi:hypothetical protein
MGKMEIPITNINKAVVNKLKEWKDSPLQFVKECIQVTPTEQQIELLMNVSKEKRVTVRSGHGVGKDAAASWIILWFMTTRPYAKVA